MSNRKFSLITAGCLSIGVALSALSVLDGAKAIAATSTSSNTQLETVDSTTYLVQRGGGRRRGGGQRLMEQLNLTEAQ
ncbi:MAG: hypothetical protein ACFCBU_13315, partial [Cyanophyceae cyanobacterium]